MMTPQEAAYRAGCIVAEVEARFAGPDGLRPTVFANIATLPAKLPQFLRHLWKKASADPAVAELLDGWECPDRPFSEVEKYSFHVGYYHQKTARDLPAGFGPKLKALRESAGHTLADLGDAAGLSRQRVHQLEAGTHRPSWAEVQALAAALDVSTEVFRDPA